MLSTLLIAVSGVASAAVTGLDYGVSFSSPVVSQNVSGELLIKWDNFNSVPGLDLQFKENDCANGGDWNSIGGGFDIDEEEYIWDTDTLDTPDGMYCLRLRDSSLR